jgi:hypothetical protein
LVPGGSSTAGEPSLPVGTGADPAEGVAIGSGDPEQPPASSARSSGTTLSDRGIVPA